MAKESSSSRRVTLPDPPAMYGVLLMNDDFTPYDWVLKLLDALFHQSREDAVKLAREMDDTGDALVGTYTMDIAETKCLIVHQMSQAAGYPLQARIKRR